MFHCRSSCCSAALLLLIALSGGCVQKSVLDAAVVDAKRPPETQAILKKAITIGKQLEAIRGLKFTKVADTNVLTHEAFVTYTRKTLEENNDPGVFVREGRMLKMFGLIPEPMNYKEMMLGQIARSVVGSYDPIGHKLRLVFGRSDAQQEETIAHELHHALQDQNFPNLVKTVNESEGDASTAARALVEAEATLVNNAYTLSKAGITLDQYRVMLGQVLLAKRKGSLDRMRQQKVPVFFIDQSAFHYAEAINFTHALYRHGGWKALNAALAEPPTSTEQILHPERYITRRDYPTTIKLEALETFLTHKYKEENLETGSLGEFRIRSVIRTFLGDARDAAATGWDGDRYSVWFNPTTKKSSLAWVTQWDSVKDAQEFAKAMKEVLEKHRSVKLAEPAKQKHGTLTYKTEKKDHGAIQVLQVGRRVTVFDGVVKADPAVFALAGKVALVYDKADRKKGAADAKPLKPSVKKPAVEKINKKTVWDGANQRFENFRYGWSVKLPKTHRWVMMEPPFAAPHEYVQLHLLGKNPGMGPALTINVSTKRPVLNLTLEQQEAVFRRGLIGSGVTGYKELGREKAKLGNLDAVLITYEGVYNVFNQQIKRLHHAYQAVDGNRVISIIVNSDPDRYETNKEGVAEFFKHLKIKPAP